MPPRFYQPSFPILPMVNLTFYIVYLLASLLFSNPYS